MRSRVNKPDLIEFAKEYLGVQVIPKHIEILLEGIGDGSKITITGRQYGRTTVRRLVEAFHAKYNPNSNDKFWNRAQTTTLNPDPGGYGEK